MRDTGNAALPAARARAIPAIDFPALFDAAPGACLILRPDPPDFHIVEVNAAYLHETTTTREALIGRPLFDAFPDNLDDAGATGVRNLRASLEMVIATGAADRIAIRPYDRADGTLEERSWSVHNTPIVRGGEVTHIIHGVEDVTALLRQTGARKEAEREQARLELLEAAGRARLHTAEARLRRVLEQAPVGMAVLRGPTHVFEVANQRYVELTGHRPLFGRTIRDALPELADQGIYELLDQTLASGMPSYAHERRVRLDRGAPGGAEELVLNWIYEPLMNDAGTPVGIAAVATDVTELVRAREQAARLAAERDAERRQLQTVLQQSPVALVIADAPSGRIRFMNAKVLEILGHHHHSEAVEQYDLDWRGFHLDGRPMAADEWPLARAVRLGETVTDELSQIVDRSGHPVQISSNAAPVRDASGAITGGVLVFRDVTAERRAEVQLREAERMQAVGTLAGGVAHEVNNQMTIVLGFAEFVLNDLGPDHPQAPDIGQVLHAAQRAAAVSQQLLAFSRRQVIQLRNVDLATLVADLAPVLRHLLGSDNALSLSVEPGRHDVTADRGQIEQVLINLVANARDAVRTGGHVTIRVDASAGVDACPAPPAESGALPPGRYVMLEVADDGSGMSAETLARMFEPFYTTKSVGKGTGLGLSMVHGVVKRHGGHIWAETELGHGTLIRILLPAALDVVDLSPDRPLPAAPLESAGRRATVLVVEDEPKVRALASRALEANGFHVLLAENGADALDLVRAGTMPDIVVTDLVMPRLNGLELSKALRALRADLPVLFVSGYLADQTAARHLLPESAAFLQKPFTPDSLVQTVGRLLERRATAP